VHPASEATGGVPTLRILVVDDEPDIGHAVRVALNDEGHKVDTVTNAVDPLAWVEAGAYDLVVLDINLGPVSGVELCRQLRNHGVSADILLVSALAGATDRVTGLDAGADDYLVKPFAIPELKARVRALARRAAQPAASAISVGDLQLNPRTLAVTRAGRAIRLTAREYAFLELLARHPGQVFSQAQIMAALWGAEGDMGSNIVEVYVRSLRRKLDQGRQDGLIETVREGGYRLPMPNVPSRRQANQAPRSDTKPQGS